MLGLYIHIPFCKEKCHYCDFFSFRGKDDLMDPYVEALIHEINSFKNDDLDIDTIYMGGGTPSILMLSYIESIMAHVKKCFKVKDDAEITIEVNPGTVNKEKLAAYRAIGIKRLSMGAQTFKETHLKRLGRVHSVEDIKSTVQAGRKAGFENISLDLIYGLPDETLEELIEDVKAGIELGVDHLSLYGLIIEESTPFYKAYEKGNLNLPHEELLLQMRETGSHLLAKAGFIHYEISNYGKKGFFSKHNLIYWQCENYIGMGANASSYWQGQRYKNNDSISGYIAEKKENKNSKLDCYKIGNKEAIEEGILLGLRLIDGINIYEFKKRYNVDLLEVYQEPIKVLKDEGCLEFNDGQLYLTPRGLAISNYCLGMFLC